jgi:ABC-type Fe3+ transport system substrate-binding protein
VLVGAPHPELARAWVSFVGSEQGRRVFANAGFVVPNPSLQP